MSSFCYEIRVTGALPAEALLDYRGLTAQTERAETILRGPLRDQAALHGLLARLELFGTQVVLVRRLTGAPGCPPVTDAGPDRTR